MGNEFKGRAEHSAECFGETRDHWWNRDFLRLMAKRWRLDTVRDVLDVGCGLGHWSVLLASVMPGDVRVTGVEREPSWVEQARARAATLGLAGLGDRRSSQISGGQPGVSRTSRARRSASPSPTTPSI